MDPTRTVAMVAEEAVEVEVPKVAATEDGDVEAKATSLATHRRALRSLARAKYATSTESRSIGVESAIDGLPPTAPMDMERTSRKATRPTRPSTV